MSNLLIIAGDPSGDLHGAGLIREIKSLRPDVHVAAMGGPRMQSVADEFLFDLASIGLSGFIDPFTQILLIRRLLSVVRRHMDRKRPAAVVPIDFYGFNHQVLGLAKHRGLPAFYYISPQVWASRLGRILKLKRLVERMLLIFPFEVPLYREAGVPCSFVGHPLLDLIPDPVPKPSRDPSEPRIGLLPGSRPEEMHRHLPVFLRALRRIRKRFPKAKVQIFASKNITDAMLQNHLNGAQRRGPGPPSPATGRMEIVRENDYQQRSRLDFAITSSGTATLENALLGIPMVVVYKINWPSYWIVRSMVRVRHIAMANILAGRELVPELIQSRMTPETVATETLRIMENPEAMKRLRRNLLSLRDHLGGPGAARRAASMILGAVAAKR